MIKNIRAVTGKSISFLIAFLMILSIMIVTIAGTTVKTAAADESQSKVYVTDDAGIFTEEEIEKLEKLCQEKSENCETDIIIITLRKNLDYSNLDNYIRDILESEYGYSGSGDNCDAVCYAIDMTSRADRIITSGKAKDDIGQSELDGIREAAEDKLSDSEYYAGCVKYINGIERYLNDDKIYQCTLYLPIKILISLGVAGISIIIMMIHAKSKMTVSGNTYAKGHMGQLIGRNDQYINTTVVRRHIQTNHGGVGGGGGGGGGGNSGSSGGHF